MMKKLYPIALIALLPSLGFAKDNFTANYVVDGVVIDDTGNFSRIDDLLESIDPLEIEKFAANYTDNSAVTVDVNIRGVDAIASYSENDKSVNFQISDLGIDVSFTGDTRSESDNLLRDFLEENGDGILTKILQKAVATTSVDPVAGNPNSLMGEMIVTDFYSAVTTSSETGFSVDIIGNTDNSEEGGKSSSASKEVGASVLSGENGTPRNSVSVGLDIGRFTTNGNDNDVIRIPVAYTHYFDNPQYQLKLSAPLAFTKVNGSSGYRGSLGAALRIPVTKDWSLTPAVRAGVAVSEDLGAGAKMYSASLTSNYNFYVGDYSFAIGNMLGKIKTGGLEADDYDIDYALDNTVFKNGVMLEGSTSVKWLGQPTSWEAALAHTSLSGSELFVDKYVDLSVSFGTRKKLISSAWNDARIGLTLTKGNNNYKSFLFNFGYKF